MDNSKNGGKNYIAVVIFMYRNNVNKRDNKIIMNDILLDIDLFNISAREPNIAKPADALVFLTLSFNK